LSKAVSDLYSEFVFIAFYLVSRFALFLFAIPRNFAIQIILPFLSPFSLSIDVNGRGALWVALPRQPTEISWVVEGRRLGSIVPGFDCGICLPVWSSARAAW
jgi:hypothetical protein